MHTIINISVTYINHHVVIRTKIEEWDASLKSEGLLTHKNFRGSFFWYSYHGADIKNVRSIEKLQHPHNIHTHTHTHTHTYIYTYIHTYIRQNKLAQKRLHWQVYSSSAHTECGRAGNLLNHWELIVWSGNILLWSTVIIVFTTHNFIVHYQFSP
jgi:hypothetical protein